MAEILLNSTAILLAILLALYLICKILEKVLYGEPSKDEDKENKMVVLLLLLLIFITLLAKSSFGQTAEYDKGQTETIMGNEDSTIVKEQKDTICYGGRE